jgi:lysophospholipase L1-like esterase
VINTGSIVCGQQEIGFDSCTSAISTRQIGSAPIRLEFSPDRQVQIASRKMPLFALAMKSTLCRLVCVLFTVTLTSAGFAVPQRWASDIAKMTEVDLTNPPATGAVVFIGSSSIRMWESLEADFPNTAVINRGFGGSELADSVFYADQIVLPYRPKAIVLYAGENDINAGKNPETVTADFKAFRNKVHSALPSTKIYYLSMKFSPSRAKFRASMQRANELIAADCAQAKNCTFVDVNTPMLDANGEPRPELFVDDMLHMRPAGYAIWKTVLTPLLQP